MKIFRFCPSVLGDKLTFLLRLNLFFFFGEREINIPNSDAAGIKFNCDVGKVGVYIDNNVYVPLNNYLCIM